MASRLSILRPSRAIILISSAHFAIVYVIELFFIAFFFYVNIDFIRGVRKVTQTDLFVHLSQVLHFRVITEECRCSEQSATWEQCSRVCPCCSQASRIPN